MAQRVKERLTEDLISEFRGNGAIVIRQLLTPDELSLLREGIEANLAQPSIRAKGAPVWK